MSISSFLNKLTMTVCGKYNTRLPHNYIRCSYTRIVYLPRKRLSFRFELNNGGFLCQLILDIDHLCNNSTKNMRFLDKEIR